MAIVKTRKDHICDYCERLILKGSKMTHDKFRTPTFTNDIQTGIQYVSLYFCFNDDNCRTKEDYEAEKECKIKGHTFVEIMEPVSCYPEDGEEQTGDFICEDCHITKDSAKELIE